MTYAPYKEIELHLNAISEQLCKENYLKGLSEEKFAERAAYYLDQYNYNQTFRVGNQAQAAGYVYAAGPESRLPGRLCPY
jgi:fido (protein-threonine AMPylation protein)